MTNKIVAGVATTTFALGILVGSAGAVVLGTSRAAPPDPMAQMADHMAAAGMGSMMSGSMMGAGGAGTGSMGGMPSGGSMPGDQHRAHHPDASPEVP